MNESIDEIIPRPRLVGPGRKEREYQARISALERERAEAGAAARKLERELEVAERVERGSMRLVDRLETALAVETKRAATADTGQKQLLLALGALQRENELLRERVAALSAPAQARLAAPRKRPWWRRFIRQSPPRRA
jgi:chromosome segregation ATPase